jgi:hypothetical protein
VLAKLALKNMKIGPKNLVKEEAKSGPGLGKQKVPGLNKNFFVSCASITVSKALCRTDMTSD